mmetsp:Transcript_38949/g.122893  ORF Transcript_38949/g.122893 Transcript_38949/m.122893 type:complete len:386 (-) Transcript_38949:130-1287(-)
MDGSDVDFEADAGPAHQESASSGSSVDFEDDYGDQPHTGAVHHNEDMGEGSIGNAVNDSLHLDRMVAWIACIQMDLQDALEEHKKEDHNVRALVQQIQDLRDATVRDSWRHLETKQKHAERMAELNERKKSLLEFRMLSELVPKNSDVVSSRQSDTMSGVRRDSDSVESPQVRIPMSSISETLTAYLPISRESVYAAFAGVGSSSPISNHNQENLDSESTDSIRSNRSVKPISWANEETDRRKHIDTVLKGEEIVKETKPDIELVYPEKMEPLVSHASDQVEDGDRGSEEEISTDEAQFSESSESIGRTKHNDVLERYKEQIAQLVTDAKFFREAGCDGESLLDELMQQCSFLPDEQHSVRIALSGLLFSHDNEELQSQEKSQDE